MDKEILIDAINSKGLRNSLITIWYNIGRALPFRAQRFPDGRVSDWYRNQFVEVHSIKPSGKGGKYGTAYGFYYRNGERANSYDNVEDSWCKIDDVEPQKIPNAACGSWVLLDILGEPTTKVTKVYELNDVLTFGMHKGKTLLEVVHEDYGWVEWAIINSEYFFCNIEAVAKERDKTIKKYKLNDVLTFGKYKGNSLRYIYENDANYFLWLIENAKDFFIDKSDLEKLIEIEKQKINNEM